MPCCIIFSSGNSTRQAYVDEFVYNYGEWNRGAGGATCGAVARRPAADERYFRYPMLRRLAERARAVVVHNPGRGAGGTRARSAGARVVEIPHLFAPPPLPDAR